MAHEPNNRNRRRSERVKTSREVIFSDYHAVGPLRKGVASDMSSTGICIRTNFPESVGARLQIELQPPASGESNEVAIFKGVVVHVTEFPDGDYAMGIRFEKASPTALRRSAQSPGVAQSTIAPKTPIPPKSEKPAPKSDSTPPPSQPSRAVQYQQIKRKRKLRPGQLAILIALAALLMYLLLTAFKNDLTVLAEKLTRVAPEERDMTEKSPEVASLETPALRTDDVEHAAQDFARTRSIIWDGTRRVMPRTRFGALAESNPAESTPATGAVLDEASLEIRRMPETSTLELPAVDPAKTTGLGRAAHTPDTADRGPTAPGLLLTSSKSVSNPGIPDLDSIESAEHPIELEVVLSLGRLRVWKGNELVREYPVGFGRDNATPLGVFTIVNKIHDPAWIDRGVVIPADSPVNPLGESWMGLAGGGVPLSIGIHPTPAGKSVGQPASRGCIRMRPPDAEALFRFCPVGTRIFIRS